MVDDYDVAGATVNAAVAFSAFIAIVVPPCSSSIGNAGCFNHSSKSIYAIIGSIGTGLLSILGRPVYPADSNFVLRASVSALIDISLNLDMALVRVPAIGL
ncbi:unnamed protein product [Linum trigynum]|uniref:Uncharacterized protein n=1 Tax=Linum trigynum TaxID=586398 RepID=A0AAV2D7V5_9ROSI